MRSGSCPGQGQEGTGQSVRQEAVVAVGVVAMSLDGFVESFVRQGRGLQ